MLAIFENIYGKPVLLETAESVPLARMRMARMAAIRGGSFLLYDTRSKLFIEEAGEAIALQEPLFRAEQFQIALEKVAMVRLYIDGTKS